MQNKLHQALFLVNSPQCEIPLSFAVGSLYSCRFHKMPRLYDTSFFFAWLNILKCNERYCWAHVWHTGIRRIFIQVLQFLSLDFKLKSRIFLSQAMNKMFGVVEFMVTAMFRLFQLLNFNNNNLTITVVIKYAFHIKSGIVLFVVVFSKQILAPFTFIEINTRIRSTMTHLSSPINI